MENTLTVNQVVLTAARAFPGKYTVTLVTKVVDGQMMEGRMLAQIAKETFLKPEEEKAFDDFIAQFTVLGG
jgi:hypothetical protein